MTLWIPGIILALIILVKLDIFFIESKSLWLESKYLNWFEKLFIIGVTRFSKYWHRYKIHLPNNDINTLRNAVLIGYHSRSTIDLAYLVLNLQLKVVIYYLVFEIPIVKFIIKSLGGIPSARGEHTIEGKLNFINILINSEQPVLLLPGGSYEFAKPSSDMYKVLWKASPGFARLIVNDIYPIKQQIRVIPFYTKNCEKCFLNSTYLYDSTSKLMRQLLCELKRGKLWYIPAFVIGTIVSFGFFLIPYPVKLDTYFGEPILVLPNESSEDFAYRVQMSLQELINKVEISSEDALYERNNHVDFISEKLSYQPYYIVKNIIVGIIFICQNTISLMFIIFLGCIVCPIILTVRDAIRYLKRIV